MSKKASNPPPPKKRPAAPPSPPSLNIIYIDKKNLRAFAQNPRKAKDPDVITKLRKLINGHGFQNPLQVYQEADGVYSILCGNHRFKAGILEGMTTFPCLVYEGTKEQAAARAISDNKSSEWTEWAFPELKDLICEIDLGELDTELLGFDASELNNIMGYTPNDPTEEWKEMPEFDNEDQMPRMKIIVGFKCDADMHDFGKLLNQRITEKTRSIWFPALGSE